MSNTVTAPAAPTIPLKYSQLIDSLSWQSLTPNTLERVNAGAFNGRELVWKNETSHWSNNRWMYITENLGFTAEKFVKEELLRKLSTDPKLKPAPELRKRAAEIMAGSEIARKAIESYKTMDILEWNAIVDTLLQEQVTSDHRSTYEDKLVNDLEAGFEKHAKTLFEAEVAPIKDEKAKQPRNHIVELAYDSQEVKDEVRKILKADYSTKLGRLDDLTQKDIEAILTKAYNTINASEINKALRHAAVVEQFCELMNKKAKEAQEQASLQETDNVFTPKTIAADVRKVLKKEDISLDDYVSENKSPTPEEYSYCTQLLYKEFTKDAAHQCNRLATFLGAGDPAESENAFKHDRVTKVTNSNIIGEACKIKVNESKSHKLAFTVSVGVTNGHLAITTSLPKLKLTKETEGATQNETFHVEVRSVGSDKLSPGETVLTAKNQPNLLEVNGEKLQKLVANFINQVIGHSKKFHAAFEK